MSGSYGSWNGTPTGASWGLLSGIFTAASTSTELKIAGQQGVFTYMIGLDDVSVTGAVPETSAVPEPTSWALMILAFAGLGAASRRRALAR